VGSKVEVEHRDKVGMHFEDVPTRMRECREYHECIFNQVYYEDEMVVVEGEEVEKARLAHSFGSNRGHTMMNASIRNSLLSNNQTDTRLCCIES
jgi:hypothetical protein